MKTQRFRRYLRHDFWVGVGLLSWFVLLSGCAGMDAGRLGDILNAAQTAQDVVNTTREVVETTDEVMDSFADIPPEDEHYLGRAVGATIAGRYTLYDDAAANAYLNELGQLLASVSDRPETFNGYRFQILDSDEINAFAAPGGLIFVTLGMLRCARHEDALAAVLAHEIGHIQEKHGLKSIKKSRLAKVGTKVGFRVADALTDSAIVDLAEVFEGAVQDVVATLVTDGYSRTSEYEADQAAITIMRRVGYDPNGLVDMLHAMAVRLDPDGQDFAKTHPKPADRIARIQNTIGPYQQVTPHPARQARFSEALRGM